MFHESNGSRETRFEETSVACEKNSEKLPITKLGQLGSIGNQGDMSFIIISYNK